MAKILIEICLISARGLPRSSSFWKLQWFVVGWIDPNSKYCSKIDSSGSSNPTWRTKFSVVIEEGELNPQGLALTVEVHSRDPLFLREKLQGTVTIPLKEFLIKFNESPDGWSSGIEEVGSFQLRKKNSGKPQGFVDVSIRISEKKEDSTTQSGSYKGHQFSDTRSGISLAIEDGPELTYPAAPPPPAGGHRRYSSSSYSHEPAAHLPAPSRTDGGRIGSYGPPSFPQDQPSTIPCAHPEPHSSNDHNYSEPGPEHRRSKTPPPPPPPSNTGFIPTFFPAAGQLPGSYVNMPATRTGGGGPSTGPGFGAGIGAGALAAGAVIFGDDFLSGSNFPAGFGIGGGSLIVEADPPF